MSRAKSGGTPLTIQRWPTNGRYRLVWDCPRRAQTRRLARRRRTNENLGGAEMTYANYDDIVVGNTKTRTRKTKKQKEEEQEESVVEKGRDE